jgi:hypothetical protein
MWRCRKLKNNNLKNIQFFPPFSLSIDAHRHTKSEREKLASHTNQLKRITERQEKREKVLEKRRAG